MTWFIVRTATRQEKRAFTSLREAGFESYLPITTRWERIGRHKMRDKRAAALFPGYLFAQIADGGFAKAEAADGVSGVLRYVTRTGELRPRKIPDELVSALFQAEMAGDFDRTRDPDFDGRPKAGDLMRVKSGGWWGHIAKIASVDGPNRVKVLLALFGRDFEVALDIAQLEAV